MSGILFTIVLNSIAFLALALFQAETVKKYFNINKEDFFKYSLFNTLKLFVYNHDSAKKSNAGPLEMYVSFGAIVSQVMLIWYSCYYSAFVSIRMRQISHFAYSICWYQFPTKFQKNIMMIIRQSNEKFMYTGFGIVNCNLETVKMVRSITFSISMVIFD